MSIGTKIQARPGILYVEARPSGHEDPFDEARPRPAREKSSLIAAKKNKVSFLSRQ